MKKQKSKHQLDYLEYYHTLEPEHKDFIKRFVNEYYHGEANQARAKIIYGKNEITKEANRNKNIQDTELFEQEGVVTYPEDFHQFMKDVCDDSDWENNYKIHGYETALDTIVAQAIEDLDNMELDIDKTLNRYYEKRRSLEKLKANEIKTDKARAKNEKK